MWRGERETWIGNLFKIAHILVIINQPACRSRLFWTGGAQLQLSRLVTRNWTFQCRKMTDGWAAGTWLG